MGEADDIWGAVADLLAPPERLSPSVWSERHRYLKPGHTERPGRWRNDYWPWQPHVLDIIVNERPKKGIIWPKAAQTGGSDTMISLIGCLVDQAPAPILYMISTDELARRFGLHRFEYMIDSAPVLRKRFKRGRKEHETILVKEFIGGMLVIAGGQSVNKLMSDPFMYRFLDEVDRLPSYKGVGSAWGLAEARGLAFSRGFQAGWSTPTLPNFGIWQLWTDLSDQRRWFVPCPHCHKEQWLKFGQVRYEGENARTARYECEHCKGVISDTQRAAAIYHGRFKTTLPAEQAAECEYAGPHIGHLSNPRLPLATVVGRWLACQNEDDKQVFYNTVLGEPYTPSTQPITPEDVEGRAVHEPKTGAPADTMFLTAGIDVQAGEWFYVDISAWTQGRLKYLLAYPRVQGWERLERVLREFEVPAGARRLRVRGAAIDCGYATTAVYEFCKRMGVNFIVPTCFWYTPPGESWHMRPVHTAGIHRYHLERNHWMDRALGRFAGGDVGASVVVPVGISDEYKAHILANVRVVVPDRFGQTKATWVLPQGMHDDYLHAALNAEFAAVQMGLDRFSEQAKAATQKRTAAHKRAVEEKRKKGGQEPWIKRDRTKSWIRKPRAPTPPRR